MDFFCFILTLFSVHLHFLALILSSSVVILHLFFSVLAVISDCGTFTYGYFLFLHYSGVVLSFFVDKFGLFLWGSAVFPRKAVAVALLKHASIIYIFCIKCKPRDI